MDWLQTEYRRQFEEQLSIALMKDAVNADHFMAHLKFTQYELNQMLVDAKEMKSQVGIIRQIANGLEREQQRVMLSRRLFLWQRQVRKFDESFQTTAATVVHDSAKASRVHALLKKLKKKEANMIRMLFNEVLMMP